VHLSIMPMMYHLLQSPVSGIVNKKDLVRFLDEICMAGAGIEVHKKETIMAALPLLAIRNKDKLLIAPQAAGHIREYLEANK
jgi:lactate dehydrogenase-like 2-hydroxyacid dehydrogenase